MKAFAIAMVLLLAISAAGRITRLVTGDFSYTRAAAGWNTGIEIALIAWGVWVLATL